MPAEIPDGAVIVARAIVNSSLWKMRPEDRVVAVTCLAIANKKAKKWFDGYKQITIQRGQFVRSRSEMAKECGLPIQVVRTSLDHLSDSEFLTRDLTRAYTIYTIPKYQHYQDLTKYSDYGVLKLTKDLTRHQPGKTSKSNQEFAHQPECKHLDSKGVASLCKLCANYPTSEISKTNHKQQHQDRPALSDLPDHPNGRPPAGGPSGVVVVVNPEQWMDPVLGNPSFKISLQYLESIKMAKAVAHTFAVQKPVGLVLRVVQQAKLQRSPAGWARIALENNWWLPEADKAEVGQIIEIIKRASEDQARAAMKKLGPDLIRERFPRKPDETEDEWFRRASQELSAAKKGAKKQ